MFSHTKRKKNEKSMHMARVHAGGRPLLDNNAICPVVCVIMQIYANLCTWCMQGHCRRQAIALSLVLLFLSSVFKP